MWFYEPKPPFDYDARSSGGLRIILDNLGIFTVHINLSTREFCAFNPHRNAAAAGVIRLHDLVLSSGTP